MAATLRASGGSLSALAGSLGGGNVSALFGDEAGVDPSSRYELLERLGKGSYGTVYKGRDLRTSELLAIKIIPLSDGEEVDTIMREIDMLRECCHPNVVRYHGSLQGPDYLWIIMEYCGGGSVTDIMTVLQAPLDEPQIAYVCAEVLKGLAYLHAAGKVHRDVKCGNILLTSRGEVKLADFGVSAQLTRTMSKRNTFIGTPHWMAPEIIQESRYDGKVDVWALGISAVEMAETVPPRWSVHPMRVIFQISREAPPALQHKGRWTLAFHDFVAACLVKEPKFRGDAVELARHAFLTAVAAPAGQGPSGVILPAIERARQAMAEKAAAAALTAGGGTGSSSSSSRGSGGGGAPGSATAASGTVVYRGGGGAGAGAGATATSSSSSGGGTGTFVVHRNGSGGRPGPGAGAGTGAPGTVRAGAGSRPRGWEAPPDEGGGAGGTVRHKPGPRGRGAPPSPRDYDGTFIVHEDEDGPSGSSPLDPAEPEEGSGATFVVHPQHSRRPPGRSGGDGAAPRRSGRAAAAAAAAAAVSAAARGASDALQAKLQKVYAAGGTVPIPFLRAADLSPLAFLASADDEDDAALRRMGMLHDPTAVDEGEDWAAAAAGGWAAGGTASGAGRRLQFDAGAAGGIAEEGDDGGAGKAPRPPADAAAAAAAAAGLLTAGLVDGGLDRDAVAALRELCGALMGDADAAAAGGAGGGPGAVGGPGGPGPAGLVVGPGALSLSGTYADGAAIAAARPPAPAPAPPACAFTARVPRSAAARLAASSTLSNLARALGWHGRALREASLSAEQAEAAARVASGLSDTLRTLLQL